MRIDRIVLLLIASTCLGTASCSDDPATPAPASGVHGSVVDADGAPVAGAAIGFEYAGDGCVLPGDRLERRPTLMLRFNVPDTAHVRLRIEDRLGDTVVVLVDEDLPAGLHAVTWPGRDADDDLVPSGMYRACVELDGIPSEDYPVFIQLTDPQAVLEGRHAATGADGGYAVPLGLLACGDVLSEDPPCTVSGTFRVVAVHDDGGTIRVARTTAAWEPGIDAIRVDLAFPGE